MRAVMQKSFGGPEVLEVVDTDRPSLLPGEVLIRVRACGVNPVDAVVRSGEYPLLGEPPFGVGWDLSGVVAEAGPGARFAVGDEVYGMPFFPRAANAYAEYVAAPSRQLARKPASLSHVQAAALPLAALTAWQGLVDRARIKPGDRVLILRAAGGVGHLAVQIAKAHGCHVTAVASAVRHGFLRGLGADELVDYRTVDFADAVQDMDVVFDSTAQGERSLSVLRAGGALVSILEDGDELATAAEARGVRLVVTSVEPDYVALERIAELADAGRLRPHVEATFDLADAASAHAAMDQGHVQGKILLTVSQ
ncbi:NADP-dependent oxidoreductase [Streptacidiphilus fuscans]|uniref:NADP-dependent oxidoreductase n=1 Tax=Streptacidiphilus fuscans TaxID=2789292 RepID=A0A931FDR8_9ACTN|nr:NADP-dependent oxidoreductase [Streptacidiphilus fuscans]MBF9066769.1 NADP-dependent oxidoreductase [Streptacidiphilus fuscans]